VIRIMVTVMVITSTSTSTGTTTITTTITIITIMVTIITTTILDIIQAVDIPEEEGGMGIRDMRGVIVAAPLRPPRRRVWAAGSTPLR
jgi:hypothetical protein